MRSVALAFVGLIALGGACRAQTYSQAQRFGWWETTCRNFAYDAQAERVRLQIGGAPFRQGSFCSCYALEMSSLTTSMEYDRDRHAEVSKACYFKLQR